MRVSRLALRVLLAWLALAAAALWTGRTAVDLLLPLIATVGESLSAEFSASYLWAADDPHMLLLRAQLLDPSPATLALGLRAGQAIETGTNLEHVLVPPVLVLTALLAWPARDLRQRLLLLVLAAPAAVLSLLLTTPLLLAGKIEVLLLERAAGMGLARTPSWVTHWMLFTEGGGRWLLALVLALVCVLLARPAVAQSARAT
jgi:hypothetical protein